jgi:hypothetical protein
LPTAVAVKPAICAVESWLALTASSWLWLKLLRSAVVNACVCEVEKPEISVAVRSDAVEAPRPEIALAVSAPTCGPEKAWMAEALMTFNCAAESAAIWALVKAWMSLGARLAAVASDMDAICAGVIPVTIEVKLKLLEG